MDNVFNFREPSFGVDFDLTPETALTWFRSKGMRPSWRFDDLMAEEHDASFTVARMLDRDMLADVKAEVDRAIEQGSTVREFTDTLRPKLQAKGWWGTDADGNRLGSAWRLETIHRTNVQQAYAVGHWEKIEQQADEAPWLMYDAVDDHRTRPWHAALDNTIKRYDDPFWTTNYPPNGYNCRCQAIQLSDADIEAAGLERKDPPDIPTKEVTDAAGVTRRVPATTDAGFNRNPGRDRLMHLRDVDADKLGQLRETAEQIGQANAVIGSLAAQGDDLPRDVQLVKHSPDDVVVTADMDKLDRVLNERSREIVEGREGKLREFLRSTDKLDIPEVEVNINVGERAAGQFVQINDGRTRVKVLRELGVKTLPIAVPRNQAAEVSRRVR